MGDVWEFDKDNTTQKFYFSCSIKGKCIYLLTNYVYTCNFNFIRSHSLNCVGRQLPPEQLISLWHGFNKVLETFFHVYVLCEHKGIRHVAAAYSRRWMEYHHKCMHMVSNKAVAYKQYSAGVKGVLMCAKNECLFCELQVWQLIQMVAQHPLLFPPRACKDTVVNAQGSKQEYYYYIQLIG